MPKHSPYEAHPQSGRARGNLKKARQGFAERPAGDQKEQGTRGYTGARTAGSHMDQGTRGVSGYAASGDHAAQGVGGAVPPGPSGDHLIPGQALGKGRRKFSVAQTTLREGGDAPGREPVRTPDPVETKTNPIA